MTANDLRTAAVVMLAHDRRLSVVHYPMLEIEALIDEGLLFVLHLTSEGEILFDPHGKLREIMSRPSAPRLREYEMAAELDRLRAFEDVEQFNHDFTFGLARLYAIGKAVVMMRLVQDGTLSSIARRHSRPCGSGGPSFRGTSWEVRRRTDAMSMRPSGACAKRWRVLSRPDN